MGLMFFTHPAVCDEIYASWQAGGHSALPNQILFATRYCLFRPTWFTFKYFNRFRGIWWNIKWECLHQNEAMKLSRSFRIFITHAERVSLLPCESTLIKFASPHFRVNIKKEKPRKPTPRPAHRELLSSTIRFFGWQLFAKREAFWKALQSEQLY